jgi:hypothetical protein
MRTLTTGEATALASSPCPLAILVEMDLTSPLNLCTASIDLTIGGTTYLGAAGLGKIEVIQDSPSEIKQIRFELSGVPSASIALALSEPVQGKAVRIKLAIFDPTTYAVLSARLRWAGRLDVMAIQDGPGSATIQVTAEHAAIDLLRPTMSYYSDSEQRRLYSSDPSLQFMADQVEQKITWPAATWRP